MYYLATEKPTVVINGVTVPSQYINAEDGIYVVVPLTDVESIGLEGAPAPEGTIFRLYDPTNGDHIYTASSEEKRALIAGGWKSEPSPGISAGSDGVGVYRVKNEASGEHLFTHLNPPKYLQPCSQELWIERAHIQLLHY